jgi:hypothetical protein
MIAEPRQVGTLFSRRQVGTLFSNSTTQTTKIAEPGATYSLTACFLEDTIMT